MTLPVYRPIWLPPDPAGYAFNPHCHLYLPYLPFQDDPLFGVATDSTAWFLTSESLDAAGLFVSEPTDLQFAEAWRRIRDDASRSWWSPPPISEEILDQHVEVFLDFARTGRKAEFQDLAQALGVPASELDMMWQGTVKRVRDG